jgi:hypothetical protein
MPPVRRHHQEIRDFQTAIELGDSSLVSYDSHSISSLNNIPTNYSITEGTKTWIMSDYIRYLEAKFIIHLRYHTIRVPYRDEALEREADGNLALINAVRNSNITGFDYYGIYVSYDENQVCITIVIGKQGDGLISYTYNPSENPGQNTWRIHYIFHLNNEYAPNIREHYPDYIHGDIYFGRNGTHTGLPTIPEAYAIMNELRNGTPTMEPAVRPLPFANTLTLSPPSPSSLLVYQVLRY